MRKTSTYNRKLTSLQRRAIRRHLETQYPTPLMTRARGAAIALVVAIAFVALGAVTFPMPTR